MKKYLVLALKGVSMGVANVIPGVSGGTLAMITGIYKELIDAIKSFDIQAIKLLFAGRFKDLVAHVNLWFLVAVFAGIGVGILTFARVLDYLFVNYPVFIWAFFFGLILGSIYFLARRIERWSLVAVLMFAAGTAVAVAISVLSPGAENDSAGYLFLCGVVAMCSMILPGLSGSFVLILMGNYHLVMIEAVNDLNLRILLPLAVGAGSGLIAFSHFLSWIMKKFQDQTIALLTGFILGSLAMLWPWKNSFDADCRMIDVNRFGAFIDANGAILHDVKVFGYRQVLPGGFDGIAAAAMGLMIIGVIAIWLMERSSVVGARDPG